MLRKKKLFGLVTAGILSLVILLGFSHKSTLMAVDTTLSADSKYAGEFKRMLELQGQRRYLAVREFAQKRVVPFESISTQDIMVEVSIKGATTNVSEITTKIESNNGQILSRYGRLVHAKVPLSLLPELAALNAVLFIGQPESGDNDKKSDEADEADSENK